MYLLAAIVLFTFFSETTGRGVTSLVERENLLRKVRFPRLVIPLAVALHSLFNLGLNLIVVFVFVLASGIEPRVSWLELVPLVALLVVFATGVTMLLSALYVRYRDMQPIWEVALQILFYASPVIYVTSTLSGPHRTGGDGESDHRRVDPDAPRPDRSERAHSSRGDRRGGSPTDPPCRGGGDLRPGHLGVHARGAADRRGPLMDPELRALRRRVEQLERERAEEIARANRALAAAQDKSYWLDRWSLDLNALMRRRGAGELLTALRAVRLMFRTAGDARIMLAKLPSRVRGARRKAQEESARAAGPSPGSERASRTRCRAFRS